MQIIIGYEASWRNSFLSGTNDEPTPKAGRVFIGSMRELGVAENYIEREVTKNTVMGILNRLIGERGKLYQARQRDNYYFANLEPHIAFKDHACVICEEVIFLRNLKKSTDQNSFTGMIKSNNPIFLSDYSQAFWGVLALDIEQLCDFILNDTDVLAYPTTPLDLDPISMVNRITQLSKQKALALDGDLPLTLAYEKLSALFGKYKPLNAKGKLIVLSMYCSALYLQLERLQSRFNMTTAKAKMGGISGISHNGISVRDFMKAYTTGKGKMVYGNPYLQSEFIKGEGKISKKLKKASGYIEIDLAIDDDTAQDLLDKIRCAGVLSFYVGKKGLAYVADITI